MMISIPAVRALVAMVGGMDRSILQHVPHVLQQGEHSFRVPHALATRGVVRRVMVEATAVAVEGGTGGASIPMRRVMEWPLGTVSIVARMMRGTVTRNRTAGLILRWNHLPASRLGVPPPVTGRVGQGGVAMGRVEDMEQGGVDSAGRVARVATIRQAPVLWQPALM